MDCREIRERLSEFIDGVLGGREASEVKAHLDQCDACSEAHRSMVNIIGHMQKMERIEEPADFLEKVNARMDQRVSSTGLMRRLFLPLRVKIPLELAAAAVVIAVIVYLGGVKEPQQLYRITVTERETPVAVKEADESGHADAAGKSAPEERRTGKKGSPIPQTPPAQEKPIETKGLEKESAPAAQAPEADKAAVLTAKPEPPAPKLEKARDSTRVLVTVTDEHTGAERMMTDYAGAEKSAIRSIKGPAPQPSLEETIHSLGGDIIEAEYEEGTHNPERMIIEIPVGEFESLIRVLARMGQIQSPPTEIKRKADERIRVELLFQHPTP